MQGSGFFVGLIVITVVLGAGIYAFWRIKLRAITKYLEINPELKGRLDTLGAFFLGGGTVGSRRTTNNNWALCFAFANSIWYYAYLGYYYGLYILFLQVAWSAALVVMARYLARYLAATDDGTVHGFIEHHYGARAAILAATATLIGYTLNIGFEIFYSSHLLLISTGLTAPQYELFLAVVVALFVGGYCALGGYIASVETGLIQNTLGVISMVMLLWLIRSTLLDRSSWHQVTSASKASHAPLSFVVGVIVFSFFFNLVDMATWQSIAANRHLSADDLHDVRKGFYISAGLQMIAPAILGTLFGAALRVSTQGVGDDEYFIAVLRPIYHGLNAGWGLFVGILFLGFISVTISSAGSYLMAAMQALAIDVVKRKQAKELRRKDISVETRSEIESDIVLWVKRRIILVVVLMTVIFWALWFGLGKIDKSGLAFQFQFVMYGAATTLVPSVIYRLFVKAKAESSWNSNAGFWSILVGLIFVIVPFGLAETPFVGLDRLLGIINMQADDIANLTPLLGLLAATIVFTSVRMLEVRRAR